MSQHHTEIMKAGNKHGVVCVMDRAPDKDSQDWDSNQIWRFTKGGGEGGGM